jgi:hypothetical protein
MVTKLLPAVLLSSWAAVGIADAADLRPETIAAFDAYTTQQERRMAADPYGRTTDTRTEGKTVDVTGGLVHHWRGAVFVPGTTVDAAVALLQNYDAHAAVYAPTVARSKVLAREGDRFTVYLRFVMRKVITVVVNSNHDARFTRDAPDRARSRIVSTRIAEVQDPGTPDERELPVGRDGGYLWRLNSYWRFLQKDGGVYIECESITLTRGIPTGFGWLVRPFVTSIPRESLAFTLETTRARLAESAATSK